MIKIDRLEKRDDPQDVELRINKVLMELREKSNYSTDKIKKLEASEISVNAELETRRFSIFCALYLLNLLILC